MTRLTTHTLLAILLISLLAACSNPIGPHASNGSSPAPAAAQPAAVQSNTVGVESTSNQADPQADDIEQALTDLDQQLNSIDTLDDFK